MDRLAASRRAWAFDGLGTARQFTLALVAALLPMLAVAQSGDSYPGLRPNTFL